MKIESTDIIPYPRELVFRTLRDQLLEMVKYLPNVDEVQVKERDELSEGAVEMVNWWKAKSDIPKIARAIVKPDMLHWLDHATWREQDWSCEWRMETAFFPDRIDCHGRNVYTALDDNRTELAIRGELNIDMKKLKGVPRLMAGAVGAGMEKFVVALITPNFKNNNEGLVKYLSATERARK